MQGVASRKPSGNKVDAAQQVLTTYEAILAHLRAHGALVNAVKPEYLLEPSDFELVMEARSAAAAGNPEQEAAQELWAPAELSFGAYSARAWNCVLLQVGRVLLAAAVEDMQGLRVCLARIRTRMCACCIMLEGRVCCVLWLVTQQKVYSITWVPCGAV
jgi:hypothetical protein